MKTVADHIRALTQDFSPYELALLAGELLTSAFRRSGYAAEAVFAAFWVGVADEDRYDLVYEMQVTQEFSDVCAGRRRRECSIPKFVGVSQPAYCINTHETSFLQHYSWYGDTRRACGAEGGSIVSNGLRLTCPECIELYERSLLWHYSESGEPLCGADFPCRRTDNMRNVTCIKCQEKLCDARYTLES